ncbi:MAG: hypothetical protein B6I35_03890, partial [Anaerolineaceae bacterium 4572_32.2]
NSWDATAAYTITPGAGGGWTDNVYTSAISGTWTVTGTVDGVDGMATLTVNPASAASVTLDPATETITAGETVTYTAVATDSYGNSWGATATYTITPGAGGGWTDNVYTSAVSGMWTVTGTVDGADGVATLTVNPGALDHFAFDPISNQTADQQFSVTITAQDEYSNTVTGYTGTVTLTDTTGTISPVATGNFASGAWTGNVTITQIQSNVTITAEDGSVSGSSNSFDVTEYKIYLPLVVRGG